MLFDTDKYIDTKFGSSQLLAGFQELRPPMNKIQANNLPKLAPDRKIVPIKIEVKIGKDLILRDRFDWDLHQVKARPCDFAKALLSQLPYSFQDHEALTNQILDQIDAHIDKYTHFPRTRINKKEEEIIQTQGACITCGSLLKPDTPEFCFQCRSQYDKRPNAKEPTAEQLNPKIIYTYMPQEEVGNWKKRMQKALEKQSQVLVRERKTCPKCQQVYPFFKTECTNDRCLYKFPKTRNGVSNQMLQDFYVMQFWQHIQPELDQVSRIHCMLEESDLNSVRDLYRKIKYILSQENTERIFGITDAQLLQLHDTLDKKFEQILTDNHKTDKIFKGKKIGKTLDLRESMIAKDADGEHDENPQFRPHNMISQHDELITDNYKMMLGLGYLKQEVLNSDVGKILRVPQTGARPGRPISMPITYEDMLQVKNWDDSKLIFKKAQNDEELQITQSNFGSSNVHQNVLPQQYQITQKKNTLETECQICYGSTGTLISCDDCPSSFHSDCLGYIQHLPRGKWKCYFCKVIRHGIPLKVPRLAPNQKPVCDILADSHCSNWETKAMQLFDILEEYPCAKSFFEPVNLTDQQLLSMKKKSKVKEDDWRPSSLTDIRARLDKREFKHHEHLYEELQICLSAYTEAINMREILYQQAQVTLNLLFTLIVECKIFEKIVNHARNSHIPEVGKDDE